MTKEQQLQIQLGVAFGIATAVFWGLYGPALTKARVGDPTPFKPFIFIGIAYLVWGVFGGAVAITAMQSKFEFSRACVNWGLIAGSLGAFGALTLTCGLFFSKGRTDVVMPIVFGGATAVSVITGLVLQWYATGTVHIDPRQVIGFLLVVVGIVLIQMYAVHDSRAGKSPTNQTIPAESAPPSSH